MMKFSALFFTTFTSFAVAFHGASRRARRRFDPVTLSDAETTTIDMNRRELSSHLAVGNPPVTLSSTKKIKPHNLGREVVFGQEQNDRDLQSPRCNQMIGNLYPGDSALDEAANALYNATNDVWLECTTGVCEVNENDDQFESLVTTLNEACYATNRSIVYEYDLYVTCTNSEGAYLEDAYYNYNFCYPDGRFCSRDDVNAERSAFLAETAASYEEEYADRNYECFWDTDLLGARTNKQAACSDPSRDLFDDPDFSAAADLLGDNVFAAYYNRTGFYTNRVTDENEFEGAQEFIDTCIAAGGRFFQYDIFISCTNTESGAVSNETILGWHDCYARDGRLCTRPIVDSLIRETALWLEDDFLDYLGNGFTCTRKQELVRSQTAPRPPPSRAPTPRTPSPPTSRDAPSSSAPLPLANMNALAISCLISVVVAAIIAV